MNAGVGILGLILLGIVVAGALFFPFIDKLEGGKRGKINKKGTLGILGLVVMLFGILGLSKYIKNYM